MNTQTNFVRLFALAAALSIAFLQTACSRSEPALIQARGAPVTVANCDQLFTQLVQPNLAYCRNCHVPKGVGDVPDGQKFMLSTNPAEDFTKLRTSWENLGKNTNGTSRILTMPSGTDARSHTGGTPWPVGSDAYRAMEAQLQGFDNPAACALSSQGDANDQPLLGSKHAKHLWASYCEDKPDSAALPQDPRSRIRPGVNAGRAVFYNAYYEDCHAKLAESEREVTTCGAWRTRRDLGQKLFIEGLASGTTAAADYNNAWKAWGLSERPANFDQMYTLRYGMNRAPFANPYPTPTDTPEQVAAGGSGQLPLGLRQLKDSGGKWTGVIGGIACFSCHGGQIGDPDEGEQGLASENLGLGNNNTDDFMAGRDNDQLAALGLPVAAPTTSDLLNLGVTTRGENNAVGAFELLFMLLDYDSLGINPNAVKNALNSSTPHPTAETQNTPAWWNYGSRPRKFFDAGQSIDSTRILMAAGNVGSSILTPDGKSYRDAIEHNDQDAAAFFLSLRSPQYPGAIDTALAEQGAILFHTKNLWAPEQNNPVPKPLGGNGSCASCHGAYSPRFVHDPTYLESPELEGVAGHISPLAVIGTDRARSDELTPYLRDAYSSTFWAYPDGQANWTALETKNQAIESADDGLPMSQRPSGACGWEREVIGYQAPPLYGTWATAPYFHNGSVPTIEQVLKSSDRPAIWRRQLQTIGPVTGYDQSLSRAYDFERLGWKHDVMTCDQVPGNSVMNCNPADSSSASIPQIIANLIEANFNWSAAVPIRDPSPGAADKRFIYDTRTISHGNAGHNFTDVLTDTERRAVIEYLKTL